MHANYLVVLQYSNYIPFSALQTNSLLANEFRSLFLHIHIENIFIEIC